MFPGQPQQDQGQDQGPPWLKALKAAGAAGQGMTGRPGQRPNPWAQLGNAVGQVGQNYRAKRNMQQNPAQQQAGMQAQGQAVNDTVNSSPKPMPDLGAPPPVGAMPTGMAGADSQDGGQNPYPDIYGSGGIVTKPTLALLGDRGPEMVQPLTSSPYRAGRAKVRPGMGMMR